MVDARIILLQRIFNQSLLDRLCSRFLPLLGTRRDALNGSTGRGDIMCFDN
jgi:hypothetical protein